MNGPYRPDRHVGPLVGRIWEPAFDVASIDLPLIATARTDQLIASGCALVELAAESSRALDRLRNGRWTRMAVKLVP